MGLARRGHRPLAAWRQGLARPGATVRSPASIIRRCARPRRRNSRCSTGARRLAVEDAAGQTGPQTPDERHAEHRHRLDLRGRQGNGQQSGSAGAVLGHEDQVRRPLLVEHGRVKLDPRRQHGERRGHEVHPGGSGPVRQVAHTARLANAPVG